MRITVTMLELQVNHLNKITGHNNKPWTRSDDNIKANIGTFYLDGAYGGYDVHEMVTENGGVKLVFGYHMPKRELYNRLNAFIDGINYERRGEK